MDGCLDTMYMHINVRSTYSIGFSLLICMSKLVIFWKRNSVREMTPTEKESSRRTRPRAESRVNNPGRYAPEEMASELVGFALNLLLEL